MASYYAIVRVVIDAEQWWPIECPIECATITIENVSAGISMRIRTNADDSMSEKSIPALAELEIESSVITFDAGTRHCWVRMVSGGIGTAVVEFVR
jgi:hypothetical protein